MTEVRILKKVAKIKRMKKGIKRKILKELTSYELLFHYLIGEMEEKNFKNIEYFLKKVLTN